MSKHWTYMGDCWDYPGYIRSDGYAIRGQYIGNQKYKARLAHRWVYEALRGPIPKGMHIDHLCRNRKCCSPWHMEIVTPRENTMRGVGPSARNAVKTHCKHGHPFDEVNTYIANDGQRMCRTCSRLRARKRRETLREAKA